MTRKNNQHNNANIPPEISKVLSRLIAQRKAVIWLRGLLAATACCIGATLTIMALDACVSLMSPTVRWTALAGIILSTAIVVFLTLIRPLRKTIALTQTALQLESNHQEMQERITSAVQLLNSEDPWYLKGSQQLIEALTSQACQEAETVTPRKEISLKPLLWPALTAAFVALTLLSVWIVWPAKTSHLLKRTVAPFSNLPTITAMELQILPGKDVLLAPGETFDVLLTDKTGKLTSAEILIEDESGNERTVAMIPANKPDSQGQFTFTLSVNKKGFRYRLRAGKALTQYYRAQVIEPPVVQRIETTYEYPAYTKVPPLTIKDSTGEIRAVLSTRITLTAFCPTDLDSAELRLNGKTVAVAQAASPTTQPGDVEAELHNNANQSQATFRFTLNKGHRGRYQLRLKRTVQEKEFSNSPAREYIIWAEDDTKPTAQFLFPKHHSITLKPTEKLPIKFFAKDDFALSSLRLKLHVDEQARPALDIGLPNELCRETRGEYPIDLSQLNLQNGQELQIQLVAQDTFVPEAQTGESAPITVRVSDEARSLPAQLVLAEEAFIQKSLTKSLKHLQSAQKQTQQLQSDLQNRPNLEKADTEKVNQAAQELAKAEKQLQELSQRLAQQSKLDVSRQINSLANDHVAPARNATQQISKASSAQQRSKLADHANQQTQRSIEKIQNLVGEVDEMSRLAQLGLDIQHLAQRQAELASKTIEQSQTESTSQPDQSAEILKQLQQEQRKLTREMQKVVDQTPHSQAENLEHSRRKSANIAQELQKLARQQDNLARDTAQLSKLDKVRNSKDSQEVQQAGKKLENAHQEAQIGRMLREQAQIARQTKDLSDDVRKHVPQANRLAQQATQQAVESAVQLHEQNPQKAAHSAQDAAQKLRQLSKQLGHKTSEKSSGSKDNVVSKGQTEPNSSTNPHQQKKQQIAQQASKLGHRQQQIAEQLDAIAEKQHKKLASTRQDQLHNETKQTAERVSELSDYAQDSRSHGMAGKYADLAKQQVQLATNSQKQATQQLTEGQSSKAAASQSQAARSLRIALRALQHMGVELAKAQREQQSDSTQNAQTAKQAKDIAKAFQQLKQASQTGDPAQMQQAAQMLQTLAQQVMDAASQQGVRMSGGEQQLSLSNQTQLPDIQTLTEHEKAFDKNVCPEGISPDDWARLPGQLRSQLLQAGKVTGPQEYHNLIRNYFEAISSKEAQAPSGSPAQESQ